MDTALFYLHLKAFGYAVPRFLAVFAVLPLLSKEALPMTLRMPVVACFAIFLAPALVDGVAEQRETLATVGIVLKELLVGAVLGFVLAIPLWAVEAMGDICDAQRGAAIAQMLNPLTGHETSSLGQLFNQAIVTFLFVIGGFLLVLGVVYDSFRIWPVFAGWPAFDAGAPRAALDLLDRFMRLTVLLAAPVVFCMFLAEAGMALVSRFVPQLQVFFLAMPVKSGVAMLVFAIYGVILFDYAQGLLQDTFREANRTVGTMIREAR